MMRGGEIFVPKIPSMKILDLAKTLAPDLETHFIGIRTGEKLHEVMITEDDARSTLEISDRYVIQSGLYEAEFLHADQRPVPPEFRYASNTNSDWTTPDNMRKMVVEAEIP